VKGFAEFGLYPLGLQKAEAIESLPALKSNSIKERVKLTGMFTDI
jgi:hypothetical protein